MDPTASLPLHFTLETIVLSGAGLLLSWAVVRRRWAAVAGAALLTVVQGLHAGQFIQGEDDGALVACRLVALAALALTVVLPDPRRVLLGAGLALMAAGTVVGAIWGGGAEDLPIAAHVPLTLGAIAVLIWTWQATRPSVRLRVLAAFISVLAVAVVVAGGSVARVAAADARDKRYATLGLEASTIVREVARTRDVLRRRAATLSPVVAIGTDRGDPKLERSRVLAGEWVVVVDAKGKRLTSVAAEDVQVPSVDVGALGVSKRALTGEVASATSVTAQALQVVAAAPIFEPGSAQTADDVIGAVIVGSTLPPRDLRDLTGDPIVDVALIGAVDTASTAPALSCAAQHAGTPEDVGFETIGCPTESGGIL